MSNTTILEVVRLRQENEDLKHRVRELEQLLMGTELYLPPHLKLTARQEQLVKVMMSRPMMTREAAMFIIYQDNPEGVEPKILDVFICKIRKKLAEHGIEIKTIWGRGWQITEDGRRRIAELNRQGAVAA